MIYANEGYGCAGRRDVSDLHGGNVLAYNRCRQNRRRQYPRLDLDLGPAEDLQVQRRLRFRHRQSELDGCVQNYTNYSSANDLQGRVDEEKQCAC